MVAYAEKNGNNTTWRARYKRPDGTYGSRSGFTSETAAENWGEEQEALIRRNLWIDPRSAEAPFGAFEAEWFAAVESRLELGTVKKYRSYLDRHVLPTWETWPLIGIFNSYVEIEKWVSELHEEYADSTVASIFATFSTVLQAAVKAHAIPANPCAGVRVTSGAYDADRLVATPAQALRAAMRLYECGLGLRGFVLGVLDFYTGCRWGELVGQQRHEYDPEQRALGVWQPLKEVGGRLFKGGKRITEEPTSASAVTHLTPTRPRRGKKGRTKTPAGTRWVPLPPSIAVLYEELLDSRHHQRFWRPAWDGVNPEEPCVADHVPAILPWFTFHEGRHTHSTWLIEDGVPEVARRARLGQKMKGISRIYDHVTPVMQHQILQALEARWWSSIAALTPGEWVKLFGWFPWLASGCDAKPLETPRKAIA